MTAYARILELFLLDRSAAFLLRVRLVDVAPFWSSLSAGKFLSINAVLLFSQLSKPGAFERSLVNLDELSTSIVEKAACTGRSIREQSEK